MQKTEARLIPHLFEPRIYQEPFWNAMQRKRYKRALCVWHRRAGKDLNFLNYIITQMHEQVCNCYYLFPLQTQGRKALWEGKTKPPESRPFLDYFPPWLVDGEPNNTEMKIKFRNKSLFQVIGVDNIDSAMGTGPYIVVFSEYSLHRPISWEYVEPILLENDGIAIFNFTPRGHNHAYKLYHDNLDNPEWWTQKLAACIHPKYNPGGVLPYTGALTAEKIDSIERSGTSESQIKQEYFCDFDVSTEEKAISLQLVESAVGRDISVRNLPKVLGADVGMSLGGDPSAIVIRQGGKVIFMEEFKFALEHQVAGRIRDRMLEFNCETAFMDASTWGHGVWSLLVGWGYPVTGVMAQEQAAEKDIYLNCRAELWLRGRKFFENKRCSIDPKLELLSKFKKELTEPEKMTQPVSGKIKIESKPDLKKRSVASGNLADAFLLTLYGGEVLIVKYGEDPDLEKSLIQGWLRGGTEQTGIPTLL